MQSAHIDFETASDLDLGEVGVYRYVEDPSTRILCMSYQTDTMKQPVVWYPGEPFPLMLMLVWKHRGMFVAWNDGFERTVWNWIGVRDHGFPKTTGEQWHNPQALAMQRNLPASLEGTAKALGLPEQKDMEGKRLMKRMAVGKDITPANLQRLGAYCAQDVRTEAGVDGALGSKWIADERRVYLLSEKINDRGIKIDVEFVRLAAKAVADYQAHMAQQMKARFGIAPAQIMELQKFCAARRVELPDLRADTVGEVLAFPEVYPDDVVEILRMREKAAGNSPKKFAAMLRAVCSDGRIRGMFSYCGASQTGRWSGRIVQPQNLPRPTMSYEDTLKAMDALRAAGGAWDALGDDPLGVLLNCIRPSLIPGRGGVFTVGDESAIEARVVAWLAGEKEPLRIFGEEGGDIYLHAAESIYHRPVTKADKPERQIGKVATLALGFGGGKHAFVTMGRGYGVLVPEEEAEAIKVAWRKAHGRIVTLWAVLDAMALKACGAKSWDYRPAQTILDLGHYDFVTARLEELGIGFAMSKGHLFAQLPSGRTIAYPNATAERVLAPALKKIIYERLLKEGKTPAEAEASAHEGAMRRRVSFYSPKGASMVRDGTYGGKLSENLTQAIARDVIAEAMMRARDLPIVLHAHDEIVAEGDHVEALKEALTRNIPWAPGLPLAAEVGTTERYWK